MTQAARFVCREKRKFLIGILAAGGVILGILLLLFHGTIFAAALTGGVDDSSIYYTNNSRQAVIPLEGDVNNGEALVGYKLQGGAFVRVSYNEITEKSGLLTVDNDWGAGVKNTYYAVLTQLSEDALDLYTANDLDAKTISDNEGNSLTLEEITVEYETGLPIIDNITYDKNVEINPASIISISFDVSDAISGIDGDSIAVSMQITDSGNHNIGSSAASKAVLQSDGSYKADFKTADLLPNLAHGMNNLNYRLNISAYDNAGNKGEILNYAVSDANLSTSDISIESVSIASNNAADSQKAVWGDTVTLTVVLDSALYAGDAKMAQINGNTANNDKDKTKDADIVFSCRLTGNTSIPSIPFTVNICGSSISKTTDDTSVSYDNLVQNVSIQSENNKHINYALENDWVNVKFRTYDNVSEIHATINGVTANLSGPKDVNGQKEYTARICMTDNSPVITSIEKAIPFEITFKHGETSYAITQENCSSQVMFYNKLQAKVEITSSKLKENGTIPVGSTGTFKITMNHKVSNPSLVFGVRNRAISLTSTDNIVWTGDFTVEFWDAWDWSPIPFRFTATDSWGQQVSKNQDSSDVTKITLSDRLQILDIGMISETNSNPNYAKLNDTVTLSFRTTRPTQIMDLQIFGEACTAENPSLDKMNWTVTYTISEEKFKDTADTKVPFYIKAREISSDGESCTQVIISYTGDQKIYSDYDVSFNSANVATEKWLSDKSFDATGVVTYLAPLVTTNIVFSDDDYADDSIADTNTYCKEGDMLKITFTSSHACSYQPSSFTINGKPVTLKSATNSSDTAWTFKYEVNDADMSSEKEVTFSLDLTDAAGNTCTVTQTDLPKVIYFAALQVDNLKQNQTVAKNGDAFTVSFQSNSPLKKVKITIGGESEEIACNYEDESQNISGDAQNIKMTSTDKKQWSIVYTIPADSFKDNQEVAFSISATDFSNQSNDLSGSVTYYAPISQSIASITFTSDNAKNASAYAKNDDSAIVTLTMTHPVNLSETKITGQTVAFSKVDDNGMKWRGTYKIADKVISDNTNITFTLTINDEAGNTSVTRTQEGLSAIRYFAPIKDSISCLTFRSNNVNKPNLYVKNGDVLTLDIGTTHPISFSGTSKIAGQPVTLTSSDGGAMAWTGQCTVGQGMLSDDTDATFEVVITDAAGNAAVAKTQADVPGIRYYAPIDTAISGFTFASSNAVDPLSLAKNGDTVTLTLSATHPVNMTNTQIAGLTGIAFAKKDTSGKLWEAQYTIADGVIPDVSNISFAFTIGDIAGNNSVTKSQENLPKIVYYAPITYSNVTIATTNSSDAAKFAKNGDNVYVTFITNHDVTLSNIAISGMSVTQAKSDMPGGNSKNWLLSCEVKDKDLADLSIIAFGVTAGDVAGNTLVSKQNTDADVQNSIQYFAPIIAVASISSSGKNTSYAKNGDTVTLSVMANHNVNVQTASILGKSAVITSDNTVKPSLSYLIPTTENIIKEGTVEFVCSLTDQAGNVFQTTQTNDPSLSQVIYDRTRPVMNVTPLFNGYTTESVTFKIDFSDANPDKQGMSVMLNGIEQITKTDLAEMSKTEFTKSITVESDDIYSLTASVTDMAGNAAKPDFSSKITIDKTKPTITSTKISFDKLQVYKSGFVLGAFLDVEDKNISEIVCMLTDSDGSRDWNWETPITTDGKKTIYMLAKDFAGNVSNDVVFDIYIDATAPEPIVTDQVSSVALTSKEKTTLISQMLLNISLQDIKVGNESADKFTSLKLVDSKGNLVTDILGTMNPGEDGSYSVPVASFGTYTLLVEAEDDVGNKTGELQYLFQFKDKSVFQKYFENKPVFYSTVTVAAVLTAGTVSILIARRRRR